MLVEANCRLRGCKYWRGIIQPDGTELSEVPICLAYPQGIPDRIAYSFREEAELHLEVQGDQEGSLTFVEGPINPEDDQEAGFVYPEEIT